MQRRSFVKKSIISGTAAVILPTISNAMSANLKAAAVSEYYELREYTLKNDTQQKLVEDYLKNAYLPALNRAGVNHTGVFTVLNPTGQTRLYVIIPYNGLEHFITITEKTDNDKALQAKGAAYLNAAAKEPAYERIESSLLRSFTSTLKLTVPAKKDRIFELRQYQSASEAAGKKKIEIFTGQGEIAIFNRLGFKPVFWGETVVGASRPNLTYMVSFDDMADKEAHWKAFGGDAQWKKISSVPEYADALLVSKITSTLLVPTAYSQI